MVMGQPLPQSWACGAQRVTQWSSAWASRGPWQWGSCKGAATGCNHGLSGLKGQPSHRHGRAGLKGAALGTVMSGRAPSPLPGNRQGHLLAHSTGIHHQHRPCTSHRLMWRSHQVDQLGRVCGSGLAVPHPAGA